MKIVAKSIKGKEFMYSAKSAHKVTTKDAKLIVDTLNRLKYDLPDNSVWFIHDIDKYDKAYIYATEQKFYIAKNGSLKRKYNPYY